ncbi:hypothetical protein O9929_14990 [Vibrio lentus]|nr:hypothetical protein [Vibrio lentus]
MRAITLLNAMSFSISPQRHASLPLKTHAELRLQQPHVVRAETRPASYRRLNANYSEGWCGNASVLRRIASF